MQRRRTVRDFSARAVPRDVIEDCLRVAGSAPSGANLQPWHFVAIGDPSVKHEIRVAAEEEEREFYEHRAPAAWLEALAPLGTDSRKPFLLLVVGHPAADAQVPDIERKPLDAISTFKV